MNTLDQALILSYLHSKMTVKNLEVAVHEMSVLNHPDTGKLQHRFEKLIHAHRNAMATMEKNIENKALLESDFEEQIDKNWEQLLSN
jgi:hypothetical protein